MPGSHTTNFYFLQDFHGGRDGRVWLAMNNSGRLCVIKLSWERSYTEEAKLWRVIWGQKDVKTMRLMNANAMMMPVVFHAFQSADVISFRPVGPKWSADSTTAITDIKNSEVQCSFDDSLEHYFNNHIQVATDAISAMAQKGYEHGDLKWEHVGLLPFQTAGGRWGVKPVLIDLHQVRFFKKDVAVEAFPEEVERVVKSSLEKLSLA